MVEPGRLARTTRTEPYICCTGTKSTVTMGARSSFVSGLSSSHESLSPASLARRSHPRRYGAASRTRRAGREWPRSFGPVSRPGTPMRGQASGIRHWHVPWPACLPPASVPLQIQAAPPLVDRTEVQHLQRNLPVGEVVRLLA